jgi:Fic family protein
MAAKAIKVDQLKQVLKLKHDGFSIKAIARLTGIARNTVKKYLLKLEDISVPVDAGELSRLIAYNQDISPAREERYRAVVRHFEYAERES